MGKYPCLRVQYVDVCTLYENILHGFSKEVDSKDKVSESELLYMNGSQVNLDGVSNLISF